jgi:5,10-methylenetetrahydromethanopterin reductase
MTAQETHSGGRVGVLLRPDLPTADVLPYVREVEALGFDELWVVEDCFLRGGIAQAATVLAATSTLRVGIGILPAAARNVAFAAMELATLADLHPGRLTVGVGHGMPAWIRQVGAWPASPLTLLEEYLAALKPLLAGETVTVAGRYVQLDGVRLAFAPDVVPPVLAGVRGPRSMAVSGRVTDGTILAEPLTPEYLAAVREQVAAPDGHRIVGFAVAAVDDDSAVALAHARPALGVVGEPDWAPHLVPLDLADDLAALRRASSGPESFAAALPDGWVRRLALAGDPVSARARLAELHAAGADCVVLLPAEPEALAALPSLATLIHSGLTQR